MGITLTRFRRTLAEQVDHIRTGGSPVVIYRFGRPTAALVSIEDLERVYEAEDDFRSGPRLTRSGRRAGAFVWAQMRERMGIARPDEGQDGELGPAFLDTRLKDRID